MKPAIVFPIHDPQGITLPHLQKIFPLLKRSFERAYISLTAETQQAQPGYLLWLKEDKFFLAANIRPNTPVGTHFHTLFAQAAAACPPEQVLHLCFIDRLAFALQSAYRESFITDIRSITPAQTPLILQRSAAAWSSHPANYQELENMVTRAGELLFGKSLEFAWCHLALTAPQLNTSLEHVHNTDMSMMAEMLLPLIETIQTRDVDWLTWEDPFMLGEDPIELKNKREASPAETRKRLSYIIPMLQVLHTAKIKCSQNGKRSL